MGQMLELLNKVVEVEDPATGTVRLRDDVTRLDAMTLDTRSKKTVRVTGVTPSLRAGVTDAP